MYLPKPNQEKLTFSVLAAAAIMHMLSRQRDAVGLSTFAEGIVSQSQTRSVSGHIHKLILELERVMQEPGRALRSSVPEVIDQLAESFHRRSLVVIFSDFFTDTDQERLFSALAHLRHNKHEVLLFHVLDHRQELDFEFRNRPHLFVDAETGSQIKLHPAEIQAQYREAMERQVQAIRLRCGQMKIDYVEANTNLDFSQILMSFMTKRARMV